MQQRDDAKHLLVVQPIRVPHVAEDQRKRDHRRHAQVGDQREQRSMILPIVRFNCRLRRVPLIHARLHRVASISCRCCSPLVFAGGAARRAAPARERRGRLRPAACRRRSVSAASSVACLASSWPRALSNSSYRCASSSRLTSRYLPADGRPLQSRKLRLPPRQARLAFPSTPARRETPPPATARCCVRRASRTFCNVSSRNLYLAICRSVQLTLARSLHRCQ